MKEFTVYENKKKVLRVLCSTLVMLLASVFVLYLGYIESSLTYRAIGSAGVIFFGYAEVFLLKRILIAYKYPEKAILVRVNAEGVVDLSSKSSKGLILWERIDEVKMTHWLNHHNILITLKPKSSYSTKVKKVQINLDTSDVKVEELLAVIEKGLKRSK